MMSKDSSLLCRSHAVALLVVLLTASCRAEPSKNEGNTPAAHPDILLVLPGAESVKYTKNFDGSVSYRLVEPHPADATIKQVKSRLEAEGWKPVPEDLMNPGLTNSHDRGWMNYIDGTRNDANVFVWAAAWESPRGDRVEYSLRYEYPKDSGPMSARSPLQLSAAYMTAPTVNIIREEVRRRGTPELPKR